MRAGELRVVDGDALKEWLAKTSQRCNAMDTECEFVGLGNGRRAAGNRNIADSHLWARERPFWPSWRLGNFSAIMVSGADFTE